MRNLFILAISLCCTCLTAMADEVQEIVNIKTPKHIQFENFDYAIERPNTAYKSAGNGMVPAFENENDNVLFELRNANINADSLINREKKGSVEWQEYKINSHDAYLYTKHSEEAHQNNINLIYLEGNSPLLLTCTYPDSSENRLSQSLKRSILSFMYVGPANGNSKYYQNSVYSIDNGGFIAQNIGVLLTTFSKSGNAQAEMMQGKQVYFQIMQENLEVKKNKRKKIANELLKGTLDEHDKIQSKNNVSINGLSGYEYSINTLNDNVISAKKYAVILFDEKRVFFFISCANDKMDEHINRFKEIARTFKVK